MHDPVFLRAPSFPATGPLTALVRRTQGGWIAGVLLSLSAVGAAHAELRVSGSDTLEAYFQDALAQYARGPGAGTPSSASYKGSTAGLRDLCGGRANIAPSSAKIDADSLRRCQAAGIEPVELPLAFDAVVVIAHPSRAPIGELSLAELKTIFAPESAGKVTRWSQVRPGQPDAPLNIVSLDPRSGTNAFFSANVHGARGFVRTDARVTADHNEVIARVAADPGAVGFVSLGALGKSRAAVWKAPVNFGKGPVVASREALANDSYGPLSRVLYLYTSKAALAGTGPDASVKGFLDWLMERAATQANQEGFVALPDQAYRDNRARLAAR
jgi:phosphate transport system substrate-binding protein